MARNVDAFSFLSKNNNKKSNGNFFAEIRQALGNHYPFAGVIEKKCYLIFYRGVQVHPPDGALMNVNSTYYSPRCVEELWSSV